MLQDLEGISKASLLSIIQPHCPHLKELAFHLPWVPTQAIGSMPPSHPMPSQLLGSSNDILVKCSSLQVLSLQDRSFSIETMGFMPSLHSLYIDTRKLPDPIVFSATDRLPRLETLRVYTHEEAFIPVLENQDFARFSMIMDERGVDGRAYAVNLDATGHRFVPDFPQYLLSPFI